MLREKSPLPGASARAPGEPLAQARGVVRVAARHAHELIAWRYHVAVVRTPGGLLVPGSLVDVRGALFTTWRPLGQSPFVSRSVRRQLLMLQVNPGSRYRCW